MESLYHPVTIGQVQISGNLFLAPVAGYSDRAFRAVCCRGGADFAYTEMVSAEALVRGNVKTFNLMRKAPEENLYAVQLFGADPASMEQAVCIVRRNFSPDIIDINAGCPVPKITKTGAGASLTRYPERLADVVSAAVSAAECVPITVKIRSGWDSDSLTWKDAATAAVEAGAAAVTLHPRTRAQGYEGSADWSLLAELSELLQRITNGLVPVFGSGDIFSPQAARDMLMQTGCSGVMFARGALGNPFIFLQTRQLLTTGQYEEVSAAQRIAAGLYELNLLCQDKGEVAACREMRKRFCAYSKGITGGSMLRGQIVEAATVSDYQRLFKPYMQSC